jgi:hypothetical protein
MLSVTHTIHSLTFKSISSFFGGTPYEQDVNKDYTLTPEGTVSLKNLHGTITVRTGLDKRSVSIKATKHASIQEHLDHMHVIEEEVTPNHLALRTAYDYEKVKGTIDYMITVPDDAQVQVSTDIGDIIIQDIHGSALANTGHGDITVYNSKKHIEANVTQQGNITIIRPQSSVQLSTNKGMVRVIDSMNSVGARAKNGKVEVKCKELPATKQMKLATEHGPVILHTTKNMNCSLTAKTENGTITSTQEITIDPAATTLNTHYWNNIKKNVYGAIGNKNASVTMFSTKGDIKILKY